MAIQDDDFSDLIGDDDAPAMGHAPVIDEPMTYQEARTKREITEAAIAELKLRELEKEVVRLDLVNKLIFDRSRQFRDGLMACARKAAPLVSGETDIKTIEKILADEFRHILAEFSKTPIIK